MEVHVCRQRPVIADKAENISSIYVLSVLLYGSECWTPLKRDMKRLHSFHHRCIRTVLGITKQQQWEQHIITSQEIRQRWGDLTTVTEMMTACRLEWLGHLHECLQLALHVSASSGGCHIPVLGMDPGRDGEMSSELIYGRVG